MSRPLTRASKVESLILDNPSLSFRSVHNNIAAGRQTHLMLFQGRPASLKALREEYLAAPPHYMEALDVVHERRGALHVFCVERTGQHPSDIADKIERHLGPETLSAYQKSIAGVAWTFMTGNEAGIRPFLESVAHAEKTWQATAGIEFGPYRLAAPRPGRLLAPDVSLLPSEETVLELAVRNGFYLQPKGCAITDIAKKAGLPASTAHHQLKRAERKVLASYVRA